MIMRRFCALALGAALLLPSGLLAQETKEAPAAAAAPESPSQIRIFELRHASASEMQRIVNELFGPTRGPQQAYYYRAGKSAFPNVGFRTSTDSRTNSFLVNGSAEQLAVIEAVLERLDRPAENEQQASAVDLRSQLVALEKEIARLKAQLAAQSKKNPARSAPAKPAGLGGTEFRSHLSGLRVLSIAAPGKRVKRGDILVQFDTSDLEADIKDRQIKVTVAEAALQQLDADLKRTKLSVNNERIDAQQRLELARLDLKSFEEGDQLVESRQLAAEVEHAKLDLAKSQRLVASGGAADFDVRKAEQSLEAAKLKLEVFERFSSPKRAAELKAAVEQSERALAKTEAEAEVQIQQSESELAARRAALELAREQLKRAADRAKVGRIIAPHDGVVAPSEHGIPLRRGSVVREGQSLIHLNRVEPEPQPQKDSKK